MNEFKVKFWGVMGSCAGASPAADKSLGMNTPCVQIEASDEIIILDSGTGIVPLGRELELMNKPLDIHLFITHFHWDHIQGFPFFSPAYDPRNNITIYGLKSEKYPLEEAFQGLMKLPYFPAPFSILKSKIKFIELNENEIVTLPSGIRIYNMHTDHPGGNLIYRIYKDNTSVSYVTDLTHGHGINDKLTCFVQDSNLMIYDSNFTNSEFVKPQYEGWGHSTWEKAVQLSVNANIDRLALFHHALHRTNYELNQSISDAKNIFENSFLAMEGQSLIL